MVSVVQLVPRDDPGAVLPALAAELADGDRESLARALDFAHAAYAGHQLSTGEPVWPHALGLAGSLAAIGMDPATRVAGVLFAAPKYVDKPETLRELFGEEVERLAAGVEKLYRLRVVIRAGRGAVTDRHAERDRQTEVLRKMVLAMVEDIRVVLIRLASRTQTLRWFARGEHPERREYAQESLDIYAPLANRLGVWQLKWEMEDLSLRLLEPELYKSIAAQLDEKRGEREAFIRDAIALLARELAAGGVKAEIAGRPKHIYSIRTKMRAKSLDFSELHDVRALRVIVASTRDCYAALGVVHNLWTPIPREFDDYISRPKPNGYRSLHTAVSGPDGRALEVQIRTLEMHRHAEFGVAAHWRYKEGGQPAEEPARANAETEFEQRIAWLRQLLAWRDEVAGASGWVEQLRHGASDATVYALTPQGRVVDLPAGSTPVDFAYALHSDLGHRCRGARVDGHLVPLDTPLANGQRVEIVAAKTGGPSRDWLNAELGYLKSHRARNKVKQWFNNLALAETVATGRAAVERELHRLGQTRASLERLAAKLGHAKPDELFAAVARDEINLRQLQNALRGDEARPAPPPADLVARKPRPSTAPSGILVVGMDRLLTQVAKCCKPVPPDAIRGFVTRGRGVSIHRADCADLKRLIDTHPERLIEAAWGEHTGGAFPVEMQVLASDRQGLLRDLGDALARERINVTAVRTQTRQDIAYMNFSFDVADLAQLRRALAVVKGVAGVMRAARA